MLQAFSKVLPARLLTVAERSIKNWVPSIARTIKTSSALLSPKRKLAGVDLCGVFPAIPTPFDADCHLAFDRLEHNFRHWSRLPFKGYVVQGSTGEFVHLTQGERVQLVKKAREMICPDQLLIAGSGCPSTVCTIDMTQRMADAGADAVMVITPGFYRKAMNDAALMRFYEKVADHSPVPVIMYSVPANTGVEISPQAVAKLCLHDKIVGLKDSSGDVGKYALMVELTSKALCNDSFQILAGSANVVSQALSAGCVGVIAGLANVLGNELCSILTLAEQGKWKEAAQLNRRMILPNAAITRQFGIPGLKAVMDKVGLYGGPPREPLLRVSSTDVQKILKTFSENGFDGFATEGYKSDEMPQPATEEEVALINRDKQTKGTAIF